MADSPGPPAPSLEEALGEKPYQFDFLQALRLLEQHYKDTYPFRFGRAKRANQEPVRIGQEPYLAFPPATISSFEPAEGDHPAKLWVRFFGLFGPQGPLPIHLTAYARRRLDQERDPTFSRFADIFHHRLLLLFYRAWADSQPTVDYDRPEDARFSRYVGSLAGVGTEPTSPDDRWMRHAEFFHIGYLASGTRHASGLKHMLEEIFDRRDLDRLGKKHRVPVEITPFVGGWLRLPKDALFQLGKRGTLGVDTVAGEYSFQRQHRFQICLGPLDLETFERFLPGSESLRRLVLIVRRVVGDSLEWDLKLILKRDQVPDASLKGTARLGLTSWFKEAPRKSDADDLTLHVDRLRGIGHASTH